MRNVICTCWDSHKDLLSASEYKIFCSKYEEGFIIIANFFLHLQTWIHHLNTSEYISFASRQTLRTRAARQNLSIDGENSPEVSTSFPESWITHSSCVGSTDFVALFDTKDSFLFSYLSWHAFAHLLCMLCDRLWAISTPWFLKGFFSFSDINFWRRSNVYESGSCNLLLVIIAATLRQYFQVFFCTLTFSFSGKIAAFSLKCKLRLKTMSRQLSDCHFVWYWHL